MVILSWPESVAASRGLPEEEGESGEALLSKRRVWLIRTAKMPFTAGKGLWRLW